MPFLQAPNTALYYDIFEPDFTMSSPPVARQVVLLLHGFAGTPESDFAGQLPQLLTRYRVLAPHLHGYGQTQLAQLHGEPYWRALPGMYVAAQEALVAAGGVLITREEMASIRCPALIIHGARDRVVPADYSRQIHKRVPGSHLLLLDAGHAAHLRCEEEYTTAVMDFFANRYPEGGNV